MLIHEVEIKPGVYWVGAIDWNLRYFHGYLTPRGTTYNSYLIVDEKVALVDTVKKPFFAEMMDNIRAIIDPSKIDYLVVNHGEMDHSGSVPEFLEIAPQAEVVTSSQGQKTLQRYFTPADSWKFRQVKTGEQLSLGKYNLHFHQTPMVHWPDSMVTYIPQAKLLLPNDAFGQHLASYQRFDDEVGWDIVHEEAAKYYANIVLPYGKQVSKALEALGGLEIDMIAPSHGIIWRSYCSELMKVYHQWSSHQTQEKALIVFDTMWGATKEIALILKEGLEAAGVPVVIRFLQTSHISEIMTDVLTSRAVLVGSPTLNNGMLPTVSAFLTYLKGLRPQQRMGLAFGSYGWGGQGAQEVSAALEALGWELPQGYINIPYYPQEEEQAEVREKGKMMGEALRAFI